MRRIALPLAALAVLGTGFAAYGAATDSAPSYRTVVARVADVEQVLDLSGTIEPSGRSELAFGTDGRVAAVRTAVGRTVRQGDVIAVLDRASLRAAVDRATADLASAKARLAADRSAQTAEVAATPDTGAATPDTGAGSGGGGGASPSPSPALAQLAQQQDAVLAAQTAASTALATSTAALATQQEACAATETPEPSATESTESTEAPASPDSPVSDGCAAALAAVQSAQASTAEAQKSLQTALLALGKTLTTATPTADTPTSTPVTETPASETPASETPTRSVTAATLADDQASIDRARADLTQARADLRAAVVRAPADGTVTALSVASGDQVTAGDTVATVVAPGVTTVTLEVTEDQAAQLEAGTPVAVTPAGASDPLDGTISRVAHLATTADGSTDPTYAVQVTLDERDLALPDGLPASVAVVVGEADDAVTVPASALSNGTVQVLRDGKAERVPVTTGVVGSTEVEVVDGLDAGTRVVLADLDAEVPSSDSPQGGFGGGGFRISGPAGGMMPAR
ncbi:efflux RND transporter periplasmic adaptor subunit [Pimelobacter simplex]|uniref:Efflux RND transporter periplasmic adaptor subunit n=1 Tax=Nocardioides simplex TaxID=2045 RepID=A0A7J5E015_NOCSI|nr:efflux RND transporter periplasmic adaptor subunit [Pimelobacter simplex]KAB2811569.1 efflux RND transporter periplasmic adaptor subunit [Pimelobacter simplex]